LGRIREDVYELPIVTAGEDFSFIPALVNNSWLAYSAADVIDHIIKKYRPDDSFVKARSIIGKSPDPYIGC
jgi:hypothetical protein